MHASIRSLFRLLFHLGAVGLLILGVLDSSFFFLPFGNDILLVVLVARSHEKFLLYLLTAAAGSTIGVLLLDLVIRRGGAEGLKRLMAEKRVNYLEKRMKQRAALALVIACLAPPPFPFTAVIAAASAFQFPRVRLLAVVFGARTVRFFIIGLAAIRFGPRILRIADSAQFVWFVAGFATLCLIGSAVSIVHWIRLSREQS
jgi:membrane protein YqaA with SNARE-associated domain